MLTIHRGDGTAGIWTRHQIIRDLTQVANQCINITNGGVVFLTFNESALIVARLPSSRTPAY